MLAAASGKPIQLQEATFGSPLPGGPAYGAVRDGRQVLVQRGAAGAGGNYGSVNFAGQTLDPLTIGKDVMWVPRGGQPTEIERRYGIGARTAEPPSTVEPPAQDPLVLRDDVDARASEARRMMQQYASKEYWDTEQGKAMMALGQQQTAPKDAKLADYYEAQRAAGIGAMDEVLAGLASVDDRYKEGGDLRKWAQANQGLALREYNKRFPGGAPGMGEGELAAPAIDAANLTTGEKALMEAQYALYGDPEAGQPAVPGGYVPDERVIGMNAQGMRTVGEGAYGFDPAYDQIEIAAPPVQPDAARASNLQPVTETAQQQKAEELLQTHLRKTRPAMMGY
jgi:hypothetical protein